MEGAGMVGARLTPEHWLEVHGLFGVTAYTDRNIDRAWNSSHMEAPVIQFGRAKVVIGVPGGALANIIFCSRGTQVIIMHSGQKEMGAERFQRLAQKHGLGVHEVVIEDMLPNRLFDVPKGVILQAVKAALADWEAKPACWTPLYDQISGIREYGRRNC